jgi:hypothetical protein
MDLECPYCEKELEICHDDGFGYEENVKHQMECNGCGKHFVFETSIVFYYEAEKADCLNDGEHQWKAQKTYPKEFTQMECSMCGETRKPTEDEMSDIMNYFKNF